MSMLDFFNLVSIDVVDMWEYSRNFEKRNLKSRLWTKLMSTFTPWPTKTVT